MWWLCEFMLVFKVSTEHTPSFKASYIPHKDLEPRIVLRAAHPKPALFREDSFNKDA